MNVLIVGTGIIGTIYGWALKRSGAQVTHLVRTGAGTRGFDIDVLDERKGYPKNALYHYEAHCVVQDGLTDEYDVVLLPVRTAQVSAALAQLAPVLGSAVFVTMSANFLGTEQWESIVPHERLIVGYPDGGGTWRGRLCWCNIGAEIHLQQPDAAQQHAAALVQELFCPADIHPDWQGNMTHWLWVHNATSTPIWLAMLRYGQLKPFLRDKALFYRSILACKEVLGLCWRRGVDTALCREENSWLTMPRAVSYGIFKLLYTCNKSMQRYSAHAMEGASEAFDCLNDIMQSADEHNFPVPELRQIGQEAAAARGL